MSNEFQNLSKFVHFTDALCEFVDNVAENYDCQFNIEIDDDKFKFDLPELVAEIRKYSQAVIDDIENFNDEPSSNEPEFTAEKTSNDEITMSDFDDVRKDRSDPVK